MVLVKWEFLAELLISFLCGVAALFFFRVAGFLSGPVTGHQKTRHVSIMFLSLLLPCSSGLLFFCKWDVFAGLLVCCVAAEKGRLDFLQGCHWAAWSGCCFSSR